MSFISTEPTTIFKASKDQTVTLHLWNRTKGEVMGLTIKGGEVFYNANSTMVEPAPNENPDTVHEIPLKKGEQITASCSKENAIEYKIV